MKSWCEWIESRCHVSGRPLKRWHLFRRIGGGVLGLLAVLVAALLLIMRSFVQDDETDVAIRFETGERSGTRETDLLFRRADYVFQASSSDSNFVAEDPRGGGGLVRGFRVRPTDSLVKGNFRSELRLRPHDVGTTLWYRASIFVPADWKASPRQVIAMQWHGTRDFFLGEPGKYPPLEISIVGEEWQVKRSWDDRIVTRTTSLGNVEGIAKLAQVPLERGKWHRWTFQVHWSSTDQGFTRVWLDDRMIADDRGANAHRDFIGAYLKAGVYVPSWRYRGVEPEIDERLLYFDDIEVRHGLNPFAVPFGLAIAGG